jgi:glutamate:Na+ symporter, ESS family
MFEQAFLPFFAPFGWISIMLIVGVILRAKVGFFQKYLFPASIIGGLLGFILISVGWINIPHATFAKFAVFFFTLNFISIGLTGADEADAKPGSTIRKTMVRGMLWMSCLWAAVFMLQALTSLGWLSLTNMFTEPVYPGFAWLLPSGFAQGPGQAVALASVWQGPFKIPNAVSFGLTFAAVGFLVSALIGVPLANWGIRKGLTAHAPKDLPQDFIVGLSDKGKGPNAGQLTTHPGNVDGMAFQVAILMATFFITYFACLGLKMILPGPIKALAFGLMFLWGMIIASIIRLILGKLGLTVYIDNNVQRRITGIAVDFMVVATLVAVKVAVVWAFIVPISILSISAAVLTTLFLMYFGSRLDHLSFERFIALFGTCTGTAASGLLLLRIVDPEFKTPAAQEVGLMNVFLLVLIPTSFFSFPMPQVGLPINIGIAVGLFIVSLIILKVTGLWGKPTWNK